MSSGHRRSFSQLQSFTNCGYQFYLERVATPRPPYRPAPWFILGNALHEAYDIWERSGRTSDPMPDLFGPIYDRIEEEEKVKQPDMNLWQWRPNVKNVVQDLRLTRENGLKQAVVFQEHCETAEWEIWHLPDDEPAIEVSFQVQFDDLTVIGKVDQILVWPDGRLSIRDLKGLPVDTPLPTPTGWTTMGEVSVGDLLIGGDGKPCKVTEKSQRSWKKCYRVTFDDGTSVLCDNEHLWKVQTAGEWGRGRRHESVQTVEELRQTLRGKNGQCRHRVMMAPGWELPEADLPLDPYLLGVWLGDGKHTSSEVTFGDDWIADELQLRGFSLGKRQVKPGGGCFTATILGIRSYLFQLGVLGDKHIPSVYLRGSYTQRLDLLRGLMDTDGSWNRARNSASFSTTNLRLARQFEELALSLGFRPRMFSHEAHGFGVTTTAYPVIFTPVTAYRVIFTPVYENPFLLPRKAAQVKFPTTRVKSNQRIITAIEPTVIQETQCVAVDSSDSTYLCGRQAVMTHNTGNKKEDNRQLGLYRVALHEVFDLIINDGEFWYTKTGTSGGWVDLRRYTREYVAGQFRRLDKAVDSGLFLTRPGDHCNLCGVYDSCPERGPLSAETQRSVTTDEDKPPF